MQKPDLMRSGFHGGDEAWQFKSTIRRFKNTEAIYHIMVQQLVDKWLPAVDLNGKGFDMLR